MADALIAGPSNPGTWKTSTNSKTMKSEISFSRIVIGVTLGWIVFWLLVGAFL